MPKIKYVIILAFILCIMGCTPYHTTLTNEELSLPATSAEKVQLYFQGETTPSANEIGSIVVADNSEKKCVQVLREQAAQIGADAIINLEVRIQTQTLIFIIIPIPINTYFVSGTAVKFIN